MSLPSQQSTTLDDSAIIEPCPLASSPIPRPKRKSEPLPPAETSSRIAKQHLIGNEIKAFVAASGMDTQTLPSPAATSKEHNSNLSGAPLQHRTSSPAKGMHAKNWRSLRSDWHPFDPSKVEAHSLITPSTS